MGTSVKQSDNGLVGNHAFSVLSTHDIKHNGKAITLIRVRNPWGKTEWKGDWSDKSPLWTPELTEQCGHVVADDGVFFMCWDDFKVKMNNVAICKYEDTHTNSLIHFTGKSNCCKFTFTKPQKHVTFILQARPDSKMKFWFDGDVSKIADNRSSMVIGRKRSADEGGMFPYEFIGTNETPIEN
jgi:hypothetical protein